MSLTGPSPQASSDNTLLIYITLSHLVRDTQIVRTNLHRLLLYFKAYEREGTETCRNTDTCRT